MKKSFIWMRKTQQYDVIVISEKIGGKLKIPNNFVYCYRYQMKNVFPRFFV